MAPDRLIHWICTAPAHRRSAELGLTRHDGRWAMCPDLIGDGHEWLDTGGVDVSDAVLHWQRVGGADGTPETAAA